MSGLFLFSFLLTLGLSFPIFRLLHHWQIYDTPNRRSLHHGNTLRMGGLIFTSGYLLTITPFLIYHRITDHLSLHNWLCLGIATLLVFLLGICDDLYNLRARNKLLFESLAGLMIYHAGIKFEVLSFSHYRIELGSFALFFTVLWVVGVINIINLLDGLDGLAAGVSLILFLFLHLAAGNHNSAFIAINTTLAAAIAAFLIFNFHPAKIFMGDSGSLVIGLYLAILLLVIPQPRTGGMGSLTILLPLALPLTDTLMAIYRRIKNKTPVFQADKKHIHHRLYQLGLSQRAVALLLYIFSLVFCTISFLDLKEQTSLTLNVSVALFTLLTLVIMPRFLEKIHLSAQEEGQKQLLLSNIATFLQAKNEAEVFILYQQEWQKMPVNKLLELHNQMLKQPNSKRKELLSTIIKHTLESQEFSS